MTVSEPHPAPAPPTPLDKKDEALLYSGDPLANCPPLRWGILGCGRVSHDFVQALKLIPTASVTACATASPGSRAPDFARQHGIATWYNSYEELAAAADIDIVYVGNVHAFRRTDGERCILAGKHVLLEKPFACNTVDAQYLIQLATQHRVFLQEGMWTRFFPAVERARQLVAEGTLGEIVSVHSDFQFNASDSEAYPDSFVYQRKLGGGASLLVAPYPIAVALLFFGSRMPDEIRALGQVDAVTQVDLQAAVTLQFPATAVPQHDQATSTVQQLPSVRGLATLSYGMLGESDEVTTVVGTKGRLTIHSPGHCPTKLTVWSKQKGRGKVIPNHYEYPLPLDTPAIKAAGGYNYPNSAGFVYEAAAVARCIARGQPCCPQFTLEETILVQRILDEVRQQLKLKGVHDE